MLMKMNFGGIALERRATFTANTIELESSIITYDLHYNKKTNMKIVAKTRHMRIPT